jgi:hypothetical protein
MKSGQLTVLFLLAQPSVESLMLTKHTVACLRSPSRALREVRVFSVRCWDV